MLLMRFLLRGRYGSGRSGSFGVTSINVGYKDPSAIIKIKTIKNIGLGYIELVMPSHKAMSGFHSVENNDILGSA